MLVVNTEAFAEFGVSPDDSKPRKTRIKLAASNLLNRRLKTIGANQFGTAGNAALQDPLGRVIRLSLRKAF